MIDSAKNGAATGNSYSLAELAEREGGEVRGDGERRIRSLRTLESAGPEDLSFLTNSRYRARARQSRAGAILVPPDLADLETDLLVCEDAYYALARLLQLFYPLPTIEPGVHPTAVLGEGCELDPTARIDAYAVLGAGCVVGAGAHVHCHVSIGRRCRLGASVVLHPNVVLYDGTEIGDRTVIHSGAVLGADGFGYAYHDGVHVKVPQVGHLVVEEDVEIGANSAVDRATLEATRVGRGTKIDNLVQVGHNVVVGEGCILCGQVGLAGSSSIGKGVVMGGQSGLSGHIHLGDGVQVAGKAAVFKSVRPGRTVAGIPAYEADQWRRHRAELRRIERLKQRIARLEREMGGRGSEDERGGGGAADR